MDLVGALVGLLLLAGVTTLLLRLPVPEGPTRILLALGRGSRRWWLLALAFALPVLAGIAVSGATAHGFALFLVVVTVIPLLLACTWTWVRARSYS
jgi:hypothetical protein